MYRGAQFLDCRHLASTFSTSSIATLATGAWPSQHGIVADTWFDRASKTPVRASGEMMLATTLAAQAARAKPRARSYVVALEGWQADLFSGDHRAMDVLRWKEVIETLEEALDGLENVANVIETVVLKHA